MKHPISFKNIGNPLASVKKALTPAPKPTVTKYVTQAEVDKVLRQVNKVSTKISKLKSREKKLTTKLQQLVVKQMTQMEEMQATYAETLAVGSS